MRKAETIAIESADQVFRDVLEKAKALESLVAPHPLSSKVAAATVKNYLSEPRHQIRLHELFVEESDRLFRQRQLEELPIEFHKSGNLRLDLLRFSVSTYDKISETLVAMIIPGC
jgi:hypothetical protein